MNVLFMTEISPFPINGGEKIRSYGLLKVLNNLDYNVTALVGNHDNINFNMYLKKEELNNIKMIELNQTKLKFKIFKLFGYFMKDKKILKQFNELDLAQIDIVVIDYYFLGQYISFFKKLNIPVFYGTHNSQALLTKQVSSENVFSYIKNNLNFVLQVFHERLFFNNADKVLVVSEKDLLYHKRFVTKNKIELIPNFLDENLYRTELIKKELYIVMTANFNAFQNIQGLKWFLINVWDQELSEKIKLKLVGKGSKDILKKLHLLDLKNVEEIGEVDSINEYIQKASISIIPLLHGSGTRLKCLESMALKTQIIGTSLGVEGIEHEGSICEVNEPKEYKYMILDFFRNKQIIENNTEKAYKIFMDKYSLGSTQIKLKKLFENIGNKDL